MNLGSGLTVLMPVTSENKRLPPTRPSAAPEKPAPSNRVRDEQDFAYGTVLTRETSSWAPVRQP